MSDRFRFTNIAHQNRQFLGPYDGASLDELQIPPTKSVLDIGCGKGAALAHLVGRGIGIEHNPTFAREARANNPEAEILERDANEVLAELECPNLVLCLGASQALGSREAALTRLAQFLPEEGYLLWGEGYWRLPPSPEYLAFLQADLSDMGTFDAGKDVAGLQCLAARESTKEEWDAYEDSYSESVQSWVRQNPLDPYADGYRQRIESWREMYLRQGRDTLGFGIYLFQKRS